MGLGLSDEKVAGVLSRSVKQVSAPYTLHPEPYTLPPTAYSLHPTPYTLHPTPYTLHPTPYTLRVKQGYLAHNKHPQVVELALRNQGFQASEWGDVEAVADKCGTRVLKTVHLHPTPYIIHPEPYTPHPTPYPLPPTPCTRTTSESLRIRMRCWVILVLCLSLCLALSLSLCVSRSVSRSVSVSLSLALSLSRSLCLSLARSVSRSLSLCLSLCVPQARACACG